VDARVERIRQKLMALSLRAQGLERIPSCNMNIGATQGQGILAGSGAL